MKKYYAAAAVAVLGAIFVGRHKLQHPKNNCSTKTSGACWKCEICREIRLDKYISVRHVDISKEQGLPAGTMFQNVKYCNDVPECVTRSENFRFFLPRAKM